MKLSYTRVLLKISGEQLAGAGGHGLDQNTVAWVANEIAQIVDMGVEVVIVVGGGNFVRGVQMEGGGLRRVTADFMGMLSGVMNATAVADVFNANSVPAYALSTIKVDQVADYYTQRRALHHLRKGRVVIVGGGIARPYVTHDTVALSLALELDCDLVCKVTKVDGVYSKDPAKHADAEKISNMTLQDAIQDNHIKVMDKAALGLALDNHKPIVVCELAEGNIRRLVEGEHIGTRLS